MSPWEKLLERPHARGHVVQLEVALHCAIDEVLGPCSENAKAHNGARHHRYWALMPAAEAIVLGLRENFPAQADDILARARRHCLQ